MWALRDKPSARSDKIKTVIQKLATREAAPAALWDFLETNEQDWTIPEHAPNERQREVMHAGLARMNLGAAHDVILDLQHNNWPHLCSCVLPHSQLSWVHAGRFLTAREHAALQGIWSSDFPALDSWLRTSRQANLVKDMAGNAFSSTVCMAVSFAVILIAH